MMGGDALIGSSSHLQPHTSPLPLESNGYGFGLSARLAQVRLFLPLRFDKNGILVRLLSPYPLPSFMTVSPHSSQTAVTHPGEGRDPEALKKVGDAPAEGGNVASEKGPSPWEVTLDKTEDPKTVATWRKWAILLTVSSGAMCVTSASSMVGVMQHVPSLVGSNTPTPAGCFC